MSGLDFPVPRPLSSLLSSVRGRRVFVGMSGGVDSSAAAYLLKSAGATVTGITMKISDDPKIQDLRAVEAVSAHLCIDHITVDCVEEFREKVIGYFIRESEAGRTPNPCAACNREFKFGLLFRKAMELGADHYATGHYAITGFDRKAQRWFLKRPKDPLKDQSYVFSILPQDVLSRTLFPMGYLEKKKTRLLAARLQIPRLSTESKDLCFMDAPKPEYLKRFIKPKRGRIHDSEGNLLGPHDGIFNYSIGQRKGLGLSGTESHYVKELDPVRNAVIVGAKEELFRDSFRISGLNWVSVSPKKKLQCSVIVRNRMKPEPCTLIAGENGEAMVEMKRHIWAVAPGQLAVFYKKDLVLAGGWISS
ncbi:MAG: tRNA 2-thiouridine(34) synthase MnmA [Candidatus Bilamarchaeaceae archaeon]